jgi:hypothetical protein
MWRLARRGSKADVSPTTFATDSKHRSLTLHGQVGKHLPLFVAYFGTDRDIHKQVLAVGTATQSPATMAAISSAKVVLLTKTA